MVTRNGDVELLKCMFNRGVHKDSTTQKGYSILWYVVNSGNIEAVRYLLDIGVAILTYAPKEREVPCEQCGENRLIIDNDCEKEDRDPCMRAIRCNQLEIVKLLDEYGSKSCKTFSALRSVLKNASVHVASYLLNKYSHAINIEYIIKSFGKESFTLLTERMYKSRPQITKLLLDHGINPAKQMCGATSDNGTMTEIGYGNLEALALYILSGVDINLRSWFSPFGKVSPFEASVLRDRPCLAEMLLISGWTRGVFSKRLLHPKFKLERLIKKWKVYDNNVVPLQQRCRCVILNQLSPRADLKIDKLPLPRLLIEFLSIPELDTIA